MSDRMLALLQKFAERGTEALIIGVILLVLGPMLASMVFKLVDKLLSAMREEARLERNASREEAAAARAAYAVEMKAERTAHRDETKQLADAMKGLELATNRQTVVVSRELRAQTELLSKINDSGDLPRVTREVDGASLTDDRRDTDSFFVPILDAEEDSKP